MPRADILVFPVKVLEVDLHRPHFEFIDFLVKGFWRFFAAPKYGNLGFDVFNAFLKMAFFAGIWKQRFK